MNKLLVFIAVFLSFLFVACSAQRSVNVELVQGFRSGAPDILRITIDQIDFTEPLVIMPYAESPLTNFSFKPHSQWNVADMHTTLIENNFFYVFGTKSVICSDEKTKLPLASLQYSAIGPASDEVLTLVNSDQFAQLADLGKVTFLCPVYIQRTPVAPDTYRLRVTQNGELPIDLELTPPIWVWSNPIIALNSASYSANSDNLLGGQVKFTFQTNTAGIHTVDIRNGPQPVYYNRRTHAFTSYQCQNGVEAYIIDGKFNGGYLIGSQLQIHVKDSAANGQDIMCTIDVDGYQNFALTERSQITISIYGAMVAQGVSFETTDATFASKLEFPILTAGPEPAESFYIEIDVRDLLYSNSPLHVNSTVEFRFAGIDLNYIFTTNHEFRQDIRCPFLQGTFSHDDSSIYIRDVSTTVSAFYCKFKFYKSTALQLTDSHPIPQLQVFVDNKALYSRTARSTTSPLHLPSRTYATSRLIQIAQDDKKIVHTINFRLSDLDIAPVLLTNPVLIFSYAKAATWATSNYADVLQCSASTPSSSAFVPLSLEFDLSRRTWTVSLRSLVDVDAFQIAIRCIREEEVVTKYDITQNVANELHVSLIDLIDGKRYLGQYSTTFTEADPQRVLIRPVSPDVPTKLINLFSTTAKYYVDDISSADAIASAAAKASDELMSSLTAAFKKQATVAQGSGVPITITPVLAAKPWIVVGFDNLGDYAPHLGQKLNDFYTKTVGNRFQSPSIRSVPLYGYSFNTTQHNLFSRPYIFINQTFTSQLPSEVEMTALDETYVKAVLEFFFAAQHTAQYGARTDSPLAFSFTLNYPSFEFEWDGRAAVMSTVEGCGFHQVAWMAYPPDDGEERQVSFDNMTVMPPRRIICGLGEFCTFDADCHTNSRCDNGVCSFIPKLEYPYVHVNSVFDLPEFGSFNHGTVATLSAFLVVMLFAIVM